MWNFKASPQALLKHLLHQAPSSSVAKEVGVIFQTPIPKWIHLIQPGRIMTRIALWVLWIPLYDSPVLPLFLKDNIFPLQKILKPVIHPEAASMQGSFPPCILHANTASP